MKTLKDILEHLKNKYKEVSIYKQLKKRSLVLRIFEAKNSKKYYYISVFNKRNEIVAYDNIYIRKIAKAEIKERIKKFNLAIKQIEDEERRKREIENTNGMARYMKNGHKLKNKKPQQKKDIGLRYKGKKLDDLLYLWILLRMTLTYADEALDDNNEKMFQFEKTDIGYLKMVSKNNAADTKLIADIYNRLASLFRDHKIFNNTPEIEYLDTMFEKYYKQAMQKLKSKNKGKNIYHIDIYLVLYILQLWKEQVEHKTLKEFKPDYTMLFKIVTTICEKYSDDVALSNTDYFAEELFHCVYGGVDEAGKQKYSWFMRLH